MKILVTGSLGQLGHCIYDVVTSPNIFRVNEYLFTSHNEFDITNPKNMDAYLQLNPDIECIINCAAYTNVDGAEKDPYTAFYVNSLGVKNLVDICEQHDIMLFHISTDYVYKDGLLSCNEESEIEPINIYGQSKRDGELNIINSKLNHWYIFRTGWLYSPYGNNFFTKIMSKYYNTEKYKDIYREEKYNENMRVVTDEIGSPTYGISLAETLVCILEHGYYATTFKNGIYNASGNGMASRYDFAANIVAGGFNIYIDGKRYGVKQIIDPIKQEDLNLPAKRPHCIIIDNKKLYSCLPVVQEHWLYDLQRCITKYEENIKYEINSNKILYGK